MLHSKMPAFLAWGPELCFFYNDAYLSILGDKHPDALGRPFQQVWPEVWPDIVERVNQTLAGEPFYFENEAFTICRNGKDEQAFFSFSYAPVHDLNGKVAGLYCALVETTAQVLAEKNWREETRLLYRLFEQAPSFMAVVREPNHVYELANSAYLRLIGSPDLIGKPLREVIHEIQQHDYLALLDQVYATGQAFVGHRMPLTRATEEGGPPEQRFVDFVFQPITGPDGAVCGIFIEGNDVTAHARAEDDLEESRGRALEVAQRLDALLESAPVGISMADVHGKLIRVNPARRRIWGGQPLAESIEDYGNWNGWWADGSARHGRRLKAGEWALVRALRGEESPRDIVEIEPFGEPGVRRTLLNCAAPVRDAEGRVIGSVSAQMDITDRVRTESALRESEAKFRTMADAMPQLVWSSLPDGHHDYYNQRWYDYTGVAQDSMNAQGWNGLLHPEDLARTVKRWRHSLDTGEPYEIEYRFRHHSGQYRWVLGRALPVRDEKDAIVRWMGTCTDIHEHKLAQEALLESDRRKDEFLAMLAHELRNPLAPITTAADLLSMGQLGQERVQQLSEVIGRQARHMTSLIDDLLDVSRVTRGLVVLGKEPTDLKHVVTEAVEQVRPLLEAKAHHLELLMDSQHVRVAGDRMRLVQVLANVLNNANKYTANGGRITLQVAADETQVVICVRDNGVGMSADLLERAFELFVQGETTSDRSQGGLGIGLALVKSIVQLHGGTVSAQSAGPGRGSAFTIALPRLAPDEAQHRLEGSEASREPASGSLRVLVVDDNIDAAQLLGVFLEMFGHQVFVEYESGKAIERARSVVPHVCLLDIGLPDMDGYELARQLRRLPGMQGAILAAVTGYSQPKDRLAAFAASFNFHFAKPVDARKLGSWLTDMAVQILGEGRQALVPHEAGGAAAPASRGRD